MYDDIDKFKEDLDRLKEKFLESGPRFSGRVEVIQDVIINLLLKASDFLSISNKKE